MQYLEQRHVFPVEEAALVIVRVDKRTVFLWVSITWGKRGKAGVLFLQVTLFCWLQLSPQSKEQMKVPKDAEDHLNKYHVGRYMFTVHLVHIVLFVQFLFYIACFVITGNQEPIPADFGSKAVYALESSLTYRRENTETDNQPHSHSHL